MRETRARRAGAHREQLEAFIERGYQHGDAVGHAYALHNLRAVDREARERRAARRDALTAIPWWIGLPLTVVAVAAAWAAYTWVSANALPLTVVAAAAAAAYVWRTRLDVRARGYAAILQVAAWRAGLPAPTRGLVHSGAAFTTGYTAGWAWVNLRALLASTALLAVVWWRHYRHDTRPIKAAPPDARGQHPLAARAVRAGLDAAKARQYDAALNAGMRPPTRVKDDHKDLIEFRLPEGMLPTDVNLARFAATLGVTEGRCRYGPARPGACLIEVLDVDPADRRVGPWPLLGQPTKWTVPVPVGVDTEGAPVTIRLGGSRLLVAGQSGSGKSRFMRMIALNAASDPTVELHLIDCKGGPAMRPLKPHAAYFHLGPPTPAVVTHLESLRDEVRRRYAADTTPDRAGWVVLVVDEAQDLWRQGGAADLVEEIARKGREVGVGLVLGSQTPDKASLPTPIVAQCDVRVCLRLADDWASRMVLGETADASKLPPGHAFIVSNDEPGVTRVVTHHVDDTQSAQHVEALEPVNTTPDRPATTLLDNVLSMIVSAGKASLPWTVLGAQLGIDPDQLRDRMRTEHGVASTTVTGGKPGPKRADLDHAATNGGQAR